MCLVNELPALADRFHRSAVKTSREESLHQGTMIRLSSRVVCLGTFDRVSGDGRELVKGFRRVAAIASRRRELKGMSC